MISTNRFIKIKTFYRFYRYKLNITVIITSCFQQRPRIRNKEFGCKISQEKLNKYLAGTDILTKNKQDKHKTIKDDFIGAGMDCAVIPLEKHKNYALVQTVDFFYPLCDDLDIMGQIALANVLSDIYAVGVTEIDKLKMIISAPSEISELQQQIVIPLIIKGFTKAANNAGCKVEVQSIIVNPWCIIGGIATSLCQRDEIIIPSNAKAGDVIVLTKPLGTHLATNAFIWMQDKNENYQKIATQFTDEDIIETYQIAVKSMTYLNRNAALLMHKYNAHAATDITGFGLLGHAKNLAEYQTDCLKFQIEKLPIMKNVLQFGKLVSQDTKLRAGKAVETSGGLLICLPAENGIKFCEDFKLVTNGSQTAWIIGTVVNADEHDAVLCDSPEFIEVILDTKI